MNRVAGLETEYGCLTGDQFGPARVVGRVRNWVFERHRYGLADMHHRDWDEPAGNGGFLFNGGRVYVDMGHLEYCTPECLTVKELLLYDRAGDTILFGALKDLNLPGGAAFIRNNVDHYTGATFGCHENYLVRRTAPLTEINVLSLLTFLTLRILYSGSGRVGSSLGAEARGDSNRPGSDGEFQISQRADYINNDLFEWVQFNRAIINTRDEPLADAGRFRRLHLLHGDSSVLPATLALKVGTTALMLDLLELDYLPKLALADAVLTFRSVSHQPDGPWIVTLQTGERMDALDVLEEFRKAAQREFAGRDEETDTLLSFWGDTLCRLRQSPKDLIGRVDWITKRWLFDQFAAQESIKWSDPWLKAQDLEYHHLDPDRNLGWPLMDLSAPWTPTPEGISHAMRCPPPHTRATARSRVMYRLKSYPGRYFVDWDVIDAEGMPSLSLGDPFDPDPLSAETWARLLDSARRPDRLSLP